MRRVAIVALPSVVAFDLATPLEVFGRVRLPDGRLGYDVRVCALEREVDAGPLALRVKHGLGELTRVDTIMLPGLARIDGDVPGALIRALQRASARGARIASICSGAFVLAATGLLDGRRATTHWLATTELARRYPNVRVDPDVLYVDEGRLLTSAGAAAGLDLCLHMVRRDYGAAVAAEAARYSVMPLERAGGQSQFIAHVAPTSEGASLEALLPWLEKNAHREISLATMARRAALSVRSLNRHFREQTGTTPLQWVLKARIRRAQALLETTTRPIERVAEDVGFSSPSTFRAHFRRLVQTSPQSYRRAFRGRT